MTDKSKHHAQIPDSQRSSQGEAPSGVDDVLQFDPVKALDVADLRHIDELGKREDDVTIEKTPTEIRAVDLGAAIIHSSGPDWHKDTKHKSDSTWHEAPATGLLPTTQSEEWYK